MKLKDLIVEYNTEVEDDNGTPWDDEGKITIKFIDLDTEKAIDGLSNITIAWSQEGEMTGADAHKVDDTIIDFKAIKSHLTAKGFKVNTDNNEYIEDAINDNETSYEYTIEI